MKKLSLSFIALLAGALFVSASAQEELPVKGASGKIQGRVVSFADYETSKMKIVGDILHSPSIPSSSAGTL